MFSIILSIIFILILIYCKKNLLVNNYCSKGYESLKMPLWAILLTIFLTLLPITSIVIFIFYIVIIVKFLKDDILTWKDESIISRVIKFLNKTY